MQLMSFFLGILLAFAITACSSSPKQTPSETASSEGQEEFWEPSAAEEKNPDPFFVDADLGEEPSSQVPEEEPSPASQPQFPEPEPVAAPTATLPDKEPASVEPSDAMRAPASDCSLRQDATTSSPQLGVARQGRKIWTENYDGNWFKVYRKQGHAFVNKNCF